MKSSEYRSYLKITIPKNVEADDWEEVADLLPGHPHISGWHPEATIEVHETMLIPGM